MPAVIVIYWIGVSMTELADSVKKVTVDGREIYLVGTAHVSQESVDDVRNTVEAVDPDSIAIELCEPRLRSMVEKDHWEKMDIFKVIKEKKSLFLLIQLIMAAFYRKLGQQLGVKPGAEMLEGVKLAQEKDVELILADRKIEITLKRVWGYLSFWNKMSLINHLLYSMIVDEKIDTEMVEQIKQQDQLESIMATFAEKFPEIKKRLIDERDIYLAQKIREAPGPKVVAIVGAGHVSGIEKHIQHEQDLEPLIQIPPKSIVPTIIKWTIPVAIIALLVYGFFKGDVQHSMESIYIWVLVNGVLSAAGAVVALAHPLTIAAAFFGAPLTSLNPMMAAGWIAGLVQALVRKPTVADFEDLPNATSTVKGFWGNTVTKILLVVVLANLGSVLGTWIALAWIAARST